MGDATLCCTPDIGYRVKLLCWPASGEAVVNAFLGGMSWCGGRKMRLSLSLGRQELLRQEAVTASTGTACVTSFHDEKFFSQTWKYCIDSLELQGYVIRFISFLFGSS